MIPGALGNRRNKIARKKPFKEAATAAEMPDKTVRYTLHHCAITELIAGRMDSQLVAKMPARPPP